MSQVIVIQEADGTYTIKGLPKLAFSSRQQTKSRNFVPNGNVFVAVDKEKAQVNAEGNTEMPLRYLVFRPDHAISQQGGWPQPFYFKPHGLNEDQEVTSLEDLPETKEDNNGTELPV